MEISGRRAPRRADALSVFTLDSCLLLRQAAVQNKAKGKKKTLRAAKSVQTPTEGAKSVPTAKERQ